MKSVAISAPVTARKGMNPIAIIGMLFFIFGFVTWMNSVLVPYLQIACELSTSVAFLVTSAFYIAYVVMAAPSTWILKVFGFKNGMAVGLLIMAVGGLIFIPAALTRTYGLFLAGLFVQATGMTVLQAASNPYITILGPAESAAKRMSIMCICNKIAGVLAPIVLGAVVLEKADDLKAALQHMTPLQKAAELDAMAAKVILPYTVIVTVLVLLSVMIYFSSLPEVKLNAEKEAGHGMAPVVKTSVFQYPHLVLGVLTLFFYVGVEVIVGDSIIKYGNSLDIKLETAKYFTACALGAMVVGYVIGVICIPKYFSQQKALVVSALLGLLFTAGALATSGYVSVAFIALLGLANSLMWPAIWPLALADLGRFTKTASSLLIMGISGGAVFPWLYGQVVDYLQTHGGVDIGHASRYAYGIMLPLYFFIFYFATSGYKAGRTLVKTV